MVGLRPIQAQATTHDPAGKGPDHGYEHRHNSDTDRLHHGHDGGYIHGEAKPLPVMDPGPGGKMNYTHSFTPQESAFKKIALEKIAIAFMLPIALLVARVLYTGRTTYLFMLWNLFLAWLPLLFAYLTLYSRRKRSITMPIFAIAWLLFLPNAPYLVTDIIHMPYPGGASSLYDAVLFFVFAMGGIFLGTASLRWMEEAVARDWGVLWGQFFALAIIGLTGFGIYIGRYLRWNSWDVVANPVPLMREIYPFFVHPFQNWQVWVFSALFGVAFAFAYRLLQEAPATVSPAVFNGQMQRRSGHRDRFDITISNNKL